MAIINHVSHTKYGKNFRTLSTLSIKLNFESYFNK